MSDSKYSLSSQLQSLNLSPSETEIYLELLQKPRTFLQLSRTTGIARTKVYRLAEQLEKRSLIARRTDDRGAFLVATDPATLEVEVVAQEEKIKAQRAILKQLIPSLTALQIPDDKRFVVRTYEGAEGLKQMCWHELKAKKELLIIGAGELEELIENRLWAQKYRARASQAGYRILHLVDPSGPCKSMGTTQYSWRYLPPTIAPPQNQVIIYNDTVSHYHWRENQKVGVEIINAPHAQLMRDIFHHYWQLAGESNQSA